MNFKFNPLIFAAVFGVFSSLGFSTPIDPPQTKVVAKYMNGTLSLNEMVVDGSGLTGSAAFATATLFSAAGGSIPPLQGTVSTSFTLYGRNDDITSILDPVNRLDEVSLASWLPHVGIRWSSGAAGGTNAFVLQKPEGMVDPAIKNQLFGVAAFKPALFVPGTLISRMDWSSTLVIAGSTTDTVNRTITVRKYWYPFKPNTFDLTVPVETTEVGWKDLGLIQNNAQLTARAASYNLFVLMPAYSGSGAPGIGVYDSSLVPHLMYPGNRLPADFKTMGGREVWVCAMNSFSPENRTYLTQDQGFFFVDVFPQPSAMITVPPAKMESVTFVSSAVTSAAKIDGSSDWMPLITISNIFPATYPDMLASTLPSINGGEITMSVVADDGRPTREVTLPAAESASLYNKLGRKPTSVGINIEQPFLIPSVNPAGNYTLNIYHEWNGVSELLASMPYIVKDRITVHANIIEIVK